MGTVFQVHERFATSPARALENGFDNSPCGFVRRATESNDPDALVDRRRRGVLEGLWPGMLDRKQRMKLLAAHGESEVHRGSQQP